jgi:hypothetical protein
MFQWERRGLVSKELRFEGNMAGYRWIDRKHYDEIREKLKILN